MRALARAASARLAATPPPRSTVHSGSGGGRPARASAVRGSPAFSPRKNTRGERARTACVSSLPGYPPCRLQSSTLPPLSLFRERFSSRVAVAGFAFPRISIAHRSRWQHDCTLATLRSAITAGKSGDSPDESAVGGRAPAGVASRSSSQGSSLLILGRVFGRRVVRALRDSGQATAVTDASP